jgi:polyvinyl alcohol dehydrogenase (cytochrome)
MITPDQEGALRLRWQGAVVAASAVAVLAMHATVAAAATPPSAAETLGNRHANASAAITATNVRSLRAAWFLHTLGPVSATPIVWRGSVLVSDWSGRVWRVNALTGQVIWRRRLETPDTTLPWYGLAGTGVVAGNVLVEVGADGRAWGLDVVTGRTRWQARLGADPSHPNDPNARYVGSLSDLLYGRGLVYVGMSSCEEPLAEVNPLFVPTARGSVIALDPATGAVVWRTWLAPAGATGVPVWSSFALDGSTGILYTDTGNNYTSPATPWSDAVVALDSATGTPLWETQIVSGDMWPPLGPDADFGAGPQLFSATIDGTTRRLVGAMQKTGEYWALDRATGAVVWHLQVASGMDGSRGEASFGLGRLFAWADGRTATGTPTAMVAAVAPSSGVPLWAHSWPNALLLSAAGFLSHDVYLVGDYAGYIRAYRASDGTYLRQAATPGHAVVCSSLWVAGRYLYVGVGLTSHPLRPHGLAAYRVP